jgi:hypothetical protein
MSENEDMLNEEEIEEIFEENASDEPSQTINKNSRKRGKSKESTMDDSGEKTVELDESSKKSDSEPVLDESSEMLKKIENRPKIVPPVRVPRTKKPARKKAVKVNTKTISRVVRFF